MDKIDEEFIIQHLETGRYGEEAEEISEETVNELSNNKGDDE